MALSDTKLRNNLKPRKKVEWLSDGHGLWARFTCVGKIYFFVRYRWQNKQMTTDIGEYLKSGGMTLAEARTECAKILIGVKDGHNPKLIKKLKVEARTTALTVEAALTYWIDNYAKRNRKTWEKDQARFSRHIIPFIGELPLDQCSDDLWINVFDEMVEAGIYSACISALATSKQALKFCRQRRQTTANPLADFDNAMFGLKVKKRERQLDAVEIATWWNGLDKRRVTLKNKILLKLLLVMGCRSIELRRSKPEHFDFKNKVWKCPAHLNKTEDKPILRPLIDPVISMLKEAIAHSKKIGAKYIFYTTADLNEPLSAESMGSVVRSLRNSESPLIDEYWCAHVLRHTFRSNASQFTEPHIAEKMLGHKLKGSWAVYDHYDYVEEMREAYSKWWDRLMLMVDKPDNVVILKNAR